MSELSVRYESEKENEPCEETKVLDIQTAQNFKVIEGKKRFLIINNHDTHGTNNYKACEKIALDK